MLRVTTFALCSVALVWVSAASAEAPSASVAPEPVEDAATIDIIAKKLCQGAPVIGTRIPVKRKCDTPRQLAQYQAQARLLIDEYRRRPCNLGAESGNNNIMPC